MVESFSVEMDNIYKLVGRVPVGKAIPFGLQHILAMFVANIAPIIIAAGACLSHHSARRKTYTRCKC